MTTNRTREAEIMRVINRVRSLFHELRAVAQELHGGSSLAGGRRGVLLNLLQDGDQTVPELARRRPVSRQHIQVLVNELMRQGLVVRKPNPAHKRSKLVSLTKKGEERIRIMLGKERRALQSLKLDAKIDELAAAANLLSEIKQALREPEWRAQITEL
jgi:DNA-binding MarR family transcriptional regulator